MKSKFLLLGVVCALQCVFGINAMEPGNAPAHQAQQSSQSQAKRVMFLDAMKRLTTMSKNGQISEKQYFIQLAAIQKLLPGVGK